MKKDIRMGTDPRTQDAVEKLQNKFCDFHTDPVGDIYLTLKSERPHRLKLLFSSVAKELDKAHKG